MKSTTPVPSSYSKLLEEAWRLLAVGRARAQQAVEREKIRTYWKLGKLVNDHLRIHDGRAAYGNKVVSQLAADLDISKDYLYDILRFQRAFRIVDSSQQLTLTHYRILSRVEDSRERKQLYQKSVREKLSVPELLNRIHSRKLLAPVESKPGREQASGAAALPSLKPRRGTLYTYRLVKPRDLHKHPDFYSIDLGFKNRIDMKLAGLKGAKEGGLIETIRTEKNPRGDRYRFRKSAASPEGLYTYKAAVQKVVDGDTLWAQVDLGFRVWSEQKLRFRGLNAAEIGGGGEKATRFVTELLSRVPFVVVKLSSRDKFDRYLTDLFYLEGEADPEKVVANGKFLNQELIDRGFANRV